MSTEPDAEGEWYEKLQLSRKSNKKIDLPGGSHTSKNALKTAVNDYGLPRTIYRDPHTCGCSEANLGIVSPIQPDGYIYADYQCASRWSNIFRFKVDEAGHGFKRKLVRDRMGNLHEILEEGKGR